jgi:hypothetical protein
LVGEVEALQVVIGVTIGLGNELYQRAKAISVDVRRSYALSLKENI